LETQVKERLTGAVILVTLIVLLVPELLTGPGPGRAHSPVVTGEPALRSYTIDLVDGGVRPDTKPAAARTLQEDAPVTSREEDREKGESDTSADAALEAEVVHREPLEASPPQAAVAELGKVPGPTPVPAARPVPSPSTPAAHGAWAVQLGSFASRDNAQRLVRELRGKGYAAFVLGGGGKSGTLYRVRVGPEADREAATTLAAKLRAAGRAGAVVEHP
jgi:DedD protein